MFLRKYCLVFAFLLMPFVSALAQKTVQIDSLQKALKGMPDDTAKAKVMQALSDRYNSVDPNGGLKWAEQAQKLADKIGWDKGMANALLRAGNSHQLLSNFDAAAKAYQQALSIFEKMNDRKGVGILKNSLGKLDLVQGHYPHALGHSMEGLKIGEQINDENLMAQASSNIAGIYFRQGKHKEALEYYGRTLVLFEKLGDKKGIGMVLSNIGAINFASEKFDSALVYLKRALEINEAQGARDVAGMNIANIAGIYLAQKKYNESLPYSYRSLRINKQMGDANNFGIDQLNIGLTYYKAAIDEEYVIVPDSLMPQNKDIALRMGIKYMEDAKSNIIAVKGDINALKEIYGSLADAYEKTGDAQSALSNYRNYQLFQDSIFSIDQRLKIADLQTARANIEKQQQVKINRLQKVKSRNETIAWISGVALLLVVTFFVAKERRKSDKLLLNILPEEVAKELKKTGTTTAQHYNEVTVLFTDFVNFTSVGERLSPQALVDELHACFKAFDGIMSKYKIEKIKTVGDAYLAVAGLPVPDRHHANNVVKASLEILEFIKQRRAQLGDNTFEIRIGVNSGSVVAGIVGVKKFAYDIWGDTVNTAARMEQNSEPGKINISQATYEMVKNEFSCTYRGEIEVKNKGGLAMYFIDTANS